MAVVRGINGSALWDQAYIEIQKSDHWLVFHEIIERKRIDKVTDPEAVAQTVREVQKHAAASRNGRLRMVRDSCSKILDVLNHVKAVGDAVASLNPYSSLAWSIVSFLIEASVRSREVESICWDELPQIVSLISRYQTVQDLYHAETSSTKAQKRLQDALIQLYTGILEYQITAVITTGSKMERLKNMFRDVPESTIKQAADAITDKQKHVMELRSDVDREISDGQFTELTTDNREIKTAVADLEVIVSQMTLEIDKIAESEDQKHRDKIVKWLSSYPHENSHKKTEKTALEGTGSWLLEHATFKAWLSSTLPAAFWLKGFMGSVSVPFIFRSPLLGLCFSCTLCL